MAHRWSSLDIDYPYDYRFTLALGKDEKSVTTAIVFTMTTAISLALPTL